MVQQATGRPRRYCSDRCRVKAFRNRERRVPLQIETTETAFLHDEESRLEGLELLAAFRRRRTAR